MNTSQIIQLLLSLSFFSVSHCLIDGLYCGNRNCYHVLGARRSSSSAELSQNYHTLARAYHPERNVEDGARATYYSVVTAYDTLINTLKRRDYNYMLDNPDRYYYHYFQYYNRRFCPNVNVRGFIAVILIIISVLQYLYKKYTFTEAVRHAMKDTKQRNHYLQLIERDGILTEIKKKIKNKKSKEDFKKEEERVILDMVENSILDDGKYSKPQVKETLLVQLLLSPYYFGCYMKWLANWYWRFNYLKEPYGDEQKEYLTRKFLNISFTDWGKLDLEMKESLLKKELWIKENQIKLDVNVQLLLSPYYFVCCMKWLAIWYLRFNYLKEPYGDEEKEYLTRKFLNISFIDWGKLDLEVKESHIKKELWIKENQIKHVENDGDGVVNDGDNEDGWRNKYENMKLFLSNLSIDYLVEIMQPLVEIMQPYVRKVLKLKKKIFRESSKKMK